MESSCYESEWNLYPRPPTELSTHPESSEASFGALVTRDLVDMEYETACQLERVLSLKSLK